MGDGQWTTNLGVEDDMTISLIWEDLRSISSLIRDDLGSIMFTSKLTNKDEKRRKENNVKDKKGRKKNVHLLPTGRAQDAPRRLSQL